MPITLINFVLVIVFAYLIINMNYLKGFKVLPILSIVLVNLIAELLAFFLNRFNVKGGSAWVYNFSLPIELICYCLIYKRLFNQKAYFIIINISVIIIPLLTIISFIRNQSLYPFHTYVFTYGSVLLLFLTLSFFIKLFIADYFFINPLKQFFFWFSIGLLLCYSGAFMYLSNLNFLFRKFTFLYSNLQNLNFILNCFLYLCIIISVECLKAYPTSQIRSL
jgi:hypothetical protein